MGAHTPFKTALSYVDNVGATALQVYVGNSRGFARPPGDPEADEAFQKGCAERGIPAFIHASLIINIGSPTPATVAQSREVLKHAAQRAREIGAQGVVFHAGSAVDATHYRAAMRQVRKVLLPLLDSGAQLLVEPTAGGGRSLASRAEHLYDYFATVRDHPNLGVCLDTCHAWAAGHDIAAPGGMTELLDALPPGRLKLIHANDSKDGCGSLRDRHETVGKGMIGSAAFAELLAHPATRDVPIIVETPSGKSGEGHAADIALLRSLRGSAI
ncbi:deoxyribonuclease IV [Allorhizocola rhizosphaerae]|uniref:deoxyribonuclease IV n=1 Tax=Allorhizocola rhizosphaerae TaxID=1872709 RepID=UPI003CCC612F